MATTDEKWGTPTGTSTIDNHGADHENGGTQEISVTGLSGLLADDQHVLDAEVITASEPYAIKWALILGLQEG